MKTQQYVFSDYHRHQQTGRYLASHLDATRKRLMALYFYNRKAKTRQDMLIEPIISYDKYNMEIEHFIVLE